MTSLVDRGEVEKLLVLNGALRGGLIDALAAPGDHEAAAVAAAAGTDERATLIMLEALVDLGVADRLGGTGSPSRYRLSVLGRRHLVDPGPDLERSSLLHQANKARGWLELPYVLARGRPPARERRGALATRNFSLTMAEGDPAIMDEVIDRCLEYLSHAQPALNAEATHAGQRPRAMLDVGGAVGHMARRFAERGFSATLLDRPEVIPIAREYLGEQSGVELVGGDLLVALPPGPFDLVFVGNVYHIYGPQLDAALTRRVFASLGRGGVIAVRDYVLDRSPRAALFAVNMLQATDHGGVWTEVCFRGWLEQAGFANIEVLDLRMVPNQLILGTRP